MLINRKLLLSILIGSVIVLTSFILFYDDWSAKKGHQNVDQIDGVKIAVLDGEKLKASAKCFRIHDKIGEMSVGVLAKARDAESDIKAEYNKIKHNPKLSAKQKNKEISKIETKWSNLSSKFSSEMQEIKNLDLKATNMIETELLKVIKDISLRTGVDAVINKGSKELIFVFYSSSRIDITDAVIAGIDRSLPNIKLKELKK
jgi:Skp family chaperone for outer membrane proteins